MNTATDRRVIVEAPVYLTHMKTREHGVLPLTNPGHFDAGVYRGVIHTVEGTATITEESA